MMCCYGLGLRLGINKYYKMKKELISPLLTMSAMILLIISRLLSSGGMDWIGYAAVVILIACAVIIAQSLNKTK